MTGAELALQIRAFLKALFVLDEVERPLRPAQQILIPHPPTRKD